MFDPIEVEIFKNVFVSIAEEMGAVLGKTALSPNIRERKDYSCALFDRQGGTFAQGSHIPVHLGAMPLAVLSAIRSVKFEPDDTVIVNDPYHGGTHLPDVTCISPLFINKILLFFIANRAHHSDIGGMTPGSMPLATSIFQEGVIIPPVKIISKGKLDHDIFKLILANVRTPDECEGDFRAQLAANALGKKRLKEIIQKYGLEKILQYTVHFQTYTEGIMRQVIAGIPDGSYAYHDFLDDDGISDSPVKIAVDLTVKGDQAVIDFSQSDSRVAGSVNVPYAVTLSAILYVFRSLIDEQIPLNAGLMKPITVRIPSGLVVNAQFPAAVSGGNVETSQRIVDVLLGALHRAIPAKIPAASAGTMNNVAFGGYDAMKERNFTYYETIGGGMGASAFHDGRSGVQTHMTNSLNTPVEALEAYLPVKINRYQLRRNSGGDGTHRGGDGIIREYEFLVPVDVTIISERRKIKPYGLSGGRPGKTGSNVLIANQKRRRLKSKTNFKTQRGDRLIIETPGGGGYGKS